MRVTLTLTELTGNTEGTNVLQACPTTGQVLCFSPKLFFFLSILWTLFNMCKVLQNLCMKAVGKKLIHVSITDSFYLYCLV